MRECACPDSKFLTCRGGVFEALPFDWTGFADCFGGFDGGLAELRVGYVLREEDVWHFLAGHAADGFDC